MSSRLSRNVSSDPGETWGSSCGAPHPTAARCLIFLVGAVLAFAGPLEEIRPGRTNGFDLRASLGEPIGSGVSTGPVGLAEQFSAETKGIRALTAWYDREGIVLWARIRPTKELTPTVAAALFDLTTSADRRKLHPFLDTIAEGRTEAYPTDGVYLFIHDGIVREIWLTQPGADEGVIRQAVKTLPDAKGPAPAPATGNPPDPPRVLKPAVPAIAAATAAAPARSGPRTLTISTLAFMPGGPLPNQSGLSFFVTLMAEGGGDATTQVSVTLRRAGQEPAAKSAVAAGSVVPPGAASPVYFLPNETLATTGGGAPVVVRATAECAGLTSFTESIVQPAGSDITGAAIAVNGAVGAPVPGEWQGTRGVWISAPVHAVGCAGQPVVATVRIRSADTNAPVKALPGAGGAFKDATGQLACRAQDTVQYPDSKWAGFRVLVPHALIDLPRAQRHRVVITFSISGGGASASAERECDLDLP